MSEVDPARPQPTQGVEAPAGGPDHAEVAFHPPVMLLGALLAGFALHWIAPLGLGGSGTPWLGLLVVAAAFGLFGWAVQSFRTRGASIPTNEPTDVIVAAGPYRFSRNPIYLSMVVLQLGIALWSGSVWFVLTAAVSAALLNRGVISREERYLERKFGEPYRAYKSRVRRWL